MFRIKTALFIVLAGCIQAAGPDALRLSLRGAVDMALAQNPAVQAARFRTVEAKANVDSTRSALLPQTTFRFGTANLINNIEAIGLTVPGLDPRAGPFNVIDARPVLEQSLFNPGLRRAVRAAGERAAEQHWHEVATREAITLAVIDYYLQVLEIETRLEAAEARLRTAEALLNQARKFLAAGTASRLDEVRASGHCDSERTIVFGLRGQRQSRKLLLAELLGVSTDREMVLTNRFRPPGNEIIDLPESVGDAVASRAEVRALESGLRTAEAEKSRAEAGRYPTVTAMADAGTLGTSFGSSIVTYGLRFNVSIPLFLGGRTEAEIRAASARVQETNERLRGMRLQAATELRIAQTELFSSIEAYRAAARTTEAARQTLELANARFEEGLSNNIEVVSAQGSLAESEALESRWLYAYHVARAKLAKTQGNVLAFLD